MKTTLLLMGSILLLTVNCKKPSELVYDNPFDAKNPQGEVLLLSEPHGGNTWQSGSFGVVRWSGQNIDSIVISLSLNNGATWDTLGVVPFRDQVYSYIVSPISQRNDRCRVRITDRRDGRPRDVSVTPFTILPVP